MNAVSWAVTGIAVAAVWSVTIVYALGVGHRHGHSEGYEMGRYDGEHGIPRLQVVRLPARRGPDGGAA